MLRRAGGATRLATRTHTRRWTHAAAPLGAAATIALYAAVGLWHIPTSRLVPRWDTYGDDVAAVLEAMYRHVAGAPWLFVGAAWLLPATVAALVPYPRLRRAYQVAAFACSLLWAVTIALVGVDGEWARLTATLREEPAMGYMLHDVLVLLLVAWSAQPRRAWPLLGGPWTAVAFARLPGDADPSPAAVGRIAPWLALGAAAASTALLLPTVRVFVEPSTGTFFLSGYSTDSMIATVLSVGMILVWVIVFHQTAHMARVSLGAAPVPALLLWALGTAAVEFYVGAAFAIVAAYASWWERRRTDMAARR